MAIQLLKNDAISFLACKPFTYRGIEYAMGDDFPQEEANNIETLVRSRFVIPVVENIEDKPRHWHTHVRTREQAMEYLNRSRVQLKMPEPYDEHDSEEVVALDVLTHPETTPEPTQEDAGEGEAHTEPTEPSEPPESPEAPENLEEDYDPADHNVDAVLQYIREHPEQKDDVLAMEAAGRGRKGLLEE